MENHTITLLLVRNGRDAVLMRVPGSDVAPIWLPRSRIVLTQRAGDEFTVQMPDWLAREKGLIATAGLDQLSLI